MLSVTVVKFGDDWCLSVDDVDGNLKFKITPEIVSNLVDSINGAACNGAGWPVYEESYR